MDTFERIANIILPYFEVILSWPVIILVLGIIFLIWFREPISELIGRIEGIIKKNGFGFIFSPSEQHHKVKMLKEDVEKMEKEYKSRIEAQINKDNIQELIDDSERMKEQYMKLLDNYRFERIYNMIYGSQINILEHLSTMGEKGERYFTVTLFFNDYIRQLPPSIKKIVSMEAYFQSLEDMRLIRYTSVGDERRVVITPFGIKFLEYIKWWYQRQYKSKPY